MDTNIILDTGNTAWMIVATLLVLLMTIPGIALFYGGLVRQKNVLSIIMQCMLIVCAVTIIWIAFGYSFVFGTDLMESGSRWGFLIGGFDKVLLNGITTGSLSAVGECKQSILGIEQKYWHVDEGPYLPLFENIHLENITSKKSQYVLHLDGFDDKSQIRNIYLKDCSFEGVEKPEINKVTGAENIRFENVTVNGEPFHEM